MLHKCLLNMFGVLLVSMLAIPAIAEEENLPIIDLNAKEIDLGHFYKNRAVLVKRTVNTPKKVDVRYSHDYQKLVCKEWDYREEYGYHPSCPDHYVCQHYPCQHRYCCGSHNGHCHTWCYSHSYDQRCHWQNTSCWHTVKYCKWQDWDTFPEHEKQKLVFKKAWDLKPHEEEYFLIWVDVPNMDSSKDILHGRPEDTVNPYKCKRGTFHKNHLNFEKTDNPDPSKEEC